MNNNIEFRGVASIFTAIGALFAIRTLIIMLTFNLKEERPKLEILLVVVIIIILLSAVLSS